MLKSGPVWALGAMSGTSLDGVDGAMLQTDGVEIFAFGESGYRAYSDTEKAVIAAAFGKWPGDEGVAAATEIVETSHAELLSTFKGPDLIGFHGQTLSHDPAGRGTHQVGDGSLLAQVLETPVVWDFRSSDVEMGGQGAPLAPFFHFACAKWIGATEPVVFLNLGGVGNVTWVDPGKDKPEDTGALLAFDTGPANAPINDLVKIRLGQAFDKDGDLAKAGSVDETMVEAFLERKYFHKIPPKSLDRNEFGDLAELVSELGNADAAATLTAISAASVASGMQYFPTAPSSILVSGGGRHNAVMMQMLSVLLECPVLPVEEVDLDGDMLEAQAFAYLAVRVLRGLATSAPMTTGVAAPVGGGTLSCPDGLV